MEESVNSTNKTKSCRFSKSTFTCPLPHNEGREYVKKITNFSAVKYGFKGTFYFPDSSQKCAVNLNLCNFSYFRLKIFAFLVLCTFISRGLKLHSG